MKRLIAVGLLFVVVAVSVCAMTVHSEVLPVEPDCCVMWWIPCPLGQIEIGSMDVLWGCGHHGTSCDVYCNAP